VFDIPISFQIGNAIQNVVDGVFIGGGLYALWRLADWLSPTNIKEQIYKEGNLATAIFWGAIFLSIAIAIS